LLIGGTAAGVGSSAIANLFNRESFKVRPARCHVIQTAASDSSCTGCGICELVCAAVHGNSIGPSMRRIWLAKDAISPISSILTCLQCEYPACYFACPLKDKALCIDNKTGARYIKPENCQGCKTCIYACLLPESRINFDCERNVAIKCDLCKDRADGPVCIEYCPVVCLEERI
jgi:Fe-S-cluster-containing hydrogenase component 2